MQYTRLFTPIRIGSMELKNRIVMPAMHHLIRKTAMPPPDSANTIPAGRRVAQASLLSAPVALTVMVPKQTPCLWRDSTIPGWKDSLRAF